MHLTKTPTTVSLEPANAAAPASIEIEVTPAMIEAGVGKLSGYRFDRGNEEDVVAAIFRAMSAARGCG
jgi:hypothetical protein